MENFEGTQEQEQRVLSYLKKFEGELNDIQETVAINDFLRYEEDTESEMPFDTFKERLTIREGDLI